MTLRLLSVLTTTASGGAEFAAVDLLQALSEQGIECRLLTNRPSLVAGTDVGAAAIDLGPKLARRTAVSMTLTSPIRAGQLATALARERRTFPFDAVLLHFKKEQLLASALPRHLAPLQVWAEWGPLPRPLMSRMTSTAYRAAARRARWVFAESEKTAESLVTAGIDDAKIVVIGNVFAARSPSGDGIRETRRRIDAPPGGFVAVCVSRFHVTKRLDRVIEAVRMLPDDVVLVLAGEGPDEVRLRSLAKPIGHRVVFLPTPRGHVLELLGAGDIQLYSPSEQEGDARGVTLGQLSGRPIVATSAEGVDGLLADGTGIVCPRPEPGAIAEAILMYRADPDRRARDAVRARRAAEERISAARGATRVASRLVAASGHS